MPGCFRKYISNTRAEIVSDTVFFKHKYLTQPTINPEDAVMTATKELNNTILCTVPQDHAQYKALKNISDMFSMIAAQKSEGKPRQSRRIKRHNEANSPRVERSKIPRGDKDLIVTCPQALVATDKTNHHRQKLTIHPNHHNQITHQQISAPEDYQEWPHKKHYYQPSKCPARQPHHKFLLKENYRSSCYVKWREKLWIQLEECWKKDTS